VVTAELAVPSAEVQTNNNANKQTKKQTPQALKTKSNSENS
jgi:hypothetical protein